MINIPSKSDKRLRALIDALRILAWSDYKGSNQKPESLTNLEFYNVFNEEWKVYEIHSYSLEKVLALIDELEYSEEELLEIRNEHWAKKSYYRENGTKTEALISEFKEKYDELKF